MKTDPNLAASRKALAALRNRTALEAARAAGLLGAAQNARVAGRVSAELVAAAKESTGLSSDTDVIEIALARLALEDDFGAKLVRNKDRFHASSILGFDLDAALRWLKPRA